MTSTDKPAGWRPVIAGAFAFFTVMAGATIPTPLYPTYVSTYGFSPLIITVIFAVYGGGVITALLGTGPWSDQIGRKPLLLGGLVCTALASLTFVLADGLALILVARVLQGLSAGIFASTATVAVAEFAPKGHDRTGGILSTIANMGGLGMGPIIGGAIVAVLPGPLVTPYLIHLALVAVAGLLLWPVAEPHPAVKDPHLHPQGLAVPEQVRPIFVPAAISAFAGFMVCGFLGAVAPGFLGRVLGYTDAPLLTGFVAGVIFLTSCIGQIAEASLPKNRKLVIGMAILTLGIALVTLALWQQSLVWLIAAIAFAGLGHGVAFKSGLSAISALTPAHQASEVTATYFVVVYVAISIPVLIIGALEGPLGLPLVAVGYGAASALLSAAACLLILRRG